MSPFEVKAEDLFPGSIDVSNGVVALLLRHNDVNAHAEDELLSITHREVESPKARQRWNATEGV